MHVVLRLVHHICPAAFSCPKELQKFAPIRLRWTRLGNRHRHGCTNILRWNRHLRRDADRRESVRRQGWKDPARCHGLRPNHRTGQVLKHQEVGGCSLVARPPAAKKGQTNKIQGSDKQTQQNDSCDCRAHRDLAHCTDKSTGRSRATDFQPFVQF